MFVWAPYRNMILNNTSKDLERRVDIRSSECVPGTIDPEAEVEKLESEVKEMAQEIVQFRATLPDQLKNTLASVLVNQRPVLHVWSDTGTSSAVPNPDAGRITSSDEESLVNVDQETTEKIRLLKEKMSSNASSLHFVLKRMRECFSKIDKLDSQNITIRPAFSRKKTS